MDCKREWSREFIDTNLTQTFRKGPLKLHRRRVLMDRERGRLPAMQSFVEAQNTINRCDNSLRSLRKERMALKSERNLIQSQIGNVAFDEITRRLSPIQKKLKEKKEEIRVLERELWAARSILTGQERPEVREFIMKCPGDGCRGFLSSAWKCGTCDKFFCSECHAQKKGMRDDSHVCNEEAKATASMIRKETKACPKCGIRISKIDGCDQMWCTGCQTTFSWNTGQILLNTVVHNPHYYEYLRRTNGAIPREAGDVPCGGLPHAYLFTRFVQTLGNITAETRFDLLGIHRGLTDVLYVRLPQFPLRAPANANRDLDIAYLLQNITEEEWGTKLEQMETKFERKKEIGLILQTFVHIGSEKLTNLQNEQDPRRRSALVEQTLKEMNSVREFINKSLLTKGVQMGMVVPQFNKYYMYRWATREEIRAEKAKTGVQASEQEINEEERVEEAAQNEIVNVQKNPVVDPVEDANELVMVEIDGEMVEMTRAQHIEMMR